MRVSGSLFFKGERGGKDKTWTFSSRLRGERYHGVAGKHTSSVHGHFCCRSHKALTCWKRSRHRPEMKPVGNVFQKSAFSQQQENNLVQQLCKEPICHS